MGMNSHAATGHRICQREPRAEVTDGYEQTYAQSRR